MRFRIGVLVLSLLPSAVIALDAPPDELFSPDKKASVKIIDLTLPGADPDTGDRTIVISAKGKELAKYPATGYLLDAFWSSDGRYAAVNDRRGNSGDYLWVFDLTNGHVLRTPNDIEIQPYMDRVIKKFPECAGHAFYKRLTEAKGWKTSDELIVQTWIGFEKIDFTFILTDTYKVGQNQLTMIDEKIERRVLKR